MKIYTKTGDKGTTGIIGKRLSKSDLLIECIGSLDELNASIGVVVSLLNNINTNEGAIGQSRLRENIIENLLNIQSHLFSFGSILANAIINFDFEKETKILEDQIDNLAKDLKPLQNFILPGGSIESAHIHLTRTICRRTERNLVKLNESYKIKDLDKIIIYINRLSDYLFTLARFVNKQKGVEDVLWE